MNTPLDLFHRSDRVLMQEMYDRLFALFELLRPMSGGEDVPPVDFQEVEVLHLADLTTWAQQLGTETLKSAKDERVPKAIHDIRGGCLAGILVTLDLIRCGVYPWGRQFAMQVFRLVRDHLKMFRNCVPQVDPVTVERDRAEHGHSISLLAEKWKDAAYRLTSEQTLEVVYECAYEGSISERCMEFSALDRIVYNCMNNAGRFAEDGKVYFHIFPIDEGAKPPILRMVLANRISAAHAAELRKRFPDGLERLFSARESTDSSGYGLNICADFVASAFGLGNWKSAVSRRYIGLKVLDDSFVVWFHWPSVV
ncbi:MAG: HAMP domain-containing histidine kinase [Opitutales bacterium]|nr:HAMP domain-containing histidine kinase [Opitutales bacterium]